MAAASSPNYRCNIATLHSLRIVASTLSQQYVLRMFQIAVIKLLGFYEPKQRYNEAGCNGGLVIFKHLGLFNVHLNLSTRVFLHLTPLKCDHRVATHILEQLPINDVPTIFITPLR
uniref:Uncharacterized protein n=1 Tax=Rhipicephalus zambeziensis TaxID=60191 RepID=A0A224Z1R6_9ACAR